MSHQGAVRLTIPSAFVMLDFVQVVCDQISQLAGFDEDTTHWVSVAVRESVINAIKHGNHEDAAKLVTIEFAFVPWSSPAELIVRVVDQGEGFDPKSISDPLARENLLNESGRGIFFMRSFMDELVLQSAPEGGMEVRMVKKLPAASFHPPAA